MSVTTIAHLRAITDDMIACGVCRITQREIGQALLMALEVFEAAESFCPGWTYGDMERFHAKVGTFLASYPKVEP